MRGKGSMVLSVENDFLREQYLKRIESGLMTAIETAKAIHMSEQELLTICSQLWKEKET